jgi:hypothetical protein
VSRPSPVRALRLSLRVPANVRAERNGFVASCFLFDAAHRAPAKDEALRKLGRALEAWLCARLDDRTIDTFLRGHGFRAVEWPEAAGDGPYVDVSVALVPLS